MKLKKHQPKVKPADDAAPAAPPAEDTAPITKNITCSYGIHRGNFPIAGMKVKDARRVLKRLIKVDDGAAAVINGQVVSEDKVIQESVTMLSFVKPSAVKGSETITLSGSEVVAFEKKYKVDAFCKLITENTVSGLYPEPIPDNVKWIVRSGKVEVYILELKPELRRVQWIAEGSTKAEKSDGKGNGYTFRRLATPYVVMSVPFVNGQLQPLLELFYRTEPLKSLDDKLSVCNLLNVSQGARVEGGYGFKNWVCTQYLEIPAGAPRADVLSEIISHVFGGGFNRSSDHDEGASGFSVYESAKDADLRVRDVNKWEAESLKDPGFVLDVNWLDAKATPRDLIEFRMKQFKAEPAPSNSKTIGNLLLAQKQVAF